MAQDRQNLPWWMKAIILLAMAPVLAYPWVLTRVSDEGTMEYLAWFYPAYVIAAGACAWLTYSERPALSWILIATLLMSHAAMAYMAFG